MAYTCSLSPPAVNTSQRLWIRLSLILNSTPELDPCFTKWESYDKFIVIYVLKGTCFAYWCSTSLVIDLGSKNVINEALMSRLYKKVGKNLTGESCFPADLLDRVIDWLIELVTGPR